MSEREGLLLAAARAGSLAEIAEIRPAIDALRDALEAIGLDELPPSTGAR